MAARRVPRTDWIAIIITSGLAAIISGTLGYLGTSATQARERETQRCQIAGQLLQDEALSPYISDQARKRLLTLGAQTLERCLETR